MLSIGTTLLGTAATLMALVGRDPSATYDEENLKAVIYARVSTEEQSQTSINEQIRRCKQYAEMKGYDVVDTYEEKGSGTKIEGREKYQKMMLESDTWDIVIMYKLDRAHRNSSNANSWAKELNRKGKNFAALDIDVDTSSAMGMGIFRIMTILHEMEVELTRERTIMGLAAKKNEGKHTGRPPFGYSSAYRGTVSDKEKDDGDKNLKGVLKIKEKEAVVVRRIFGLSESNLSWALIAHTLNEEAHPTRYDGKVWTPSVVGNILKREIFYRGFFKDAEGEMQEYEWDPILSRWDDIYD